MKATGIVRRLDDLGRLVIPKEIRKIYKLKEGDSIEFFVSENSEIMIKKYQYLKDEFKQIEGMIEIFQDLFKCPLMFYGDDHLTAIHEMITGRELSQECLDHIKTYHEETFNNIRLFYEDDTLLSITVFPLVLDSHWVGAFIITEATPSDSMRSVLNTFTRLLARQMEN